MPRAGAESRILPACGRVWAEAGGHQNRTTALLWLTPLAGAGLVLLMLGAMATHLRRREYPNVVPNLVLLALAGFVAYGRFATA